MEYKSTQLQEAYIKGLKESQCELRDKFAMRAMQGILSNIDINKVNNRFAEYVKVVHDSYKIADEMMEARK